MTQHRIVSLIPSATEIVAALGYEHLLVGRSHECDFPLTVKQLVICSEPRIDVSGTSRQIDKAVVDAVRDALSIYRVFTEELERLRPTIVVTQTQCDVCAVNLRDVEAAVCELVDSKPSIVALAPMALPDIWDDIMHVAEAIGDVAAGKDLVAKLQSRLDAIASSHAQASRQPTIACIEWLDPLMVAGNWIPELVEIAGGQPVLCESGKHSPWVSWEDLQRSDPDCIAIMPCGFNIDRTMREIQLLTEHPIWLKLKAVRNNRVFLTDGNQYFNRSGPRVVESTAILSEIIRPDVGSLRHLGSGWQQLSSG